MKNPIVPSQKQNPAYLCITILSLFQETQVTEIIMSESQKQEDNKMTGGGKIIFKFITFCGKLEPQRKEIGLEIIIYCKLYLSLVIH